MGVPAFFRWLTGHKKYPSIIVYCVEEKAKDVNGVKVPVDTSKPNPNDIEFDNLYLDMNGIIHPCCHPEDKPAPKNEDEMMVLIFEYIDRIFSIVRPRKLLYMAIDGVAPRAKMNQQRSRRFRASKEASEKAIEITDVREELLSKGFNVPPEKKAEEKFDSNCITPGTPFMFHLADCLRYYVHDRMNNDPGWQGIKVILSDANVPGEGEHKIMDYIRRQRAQPDHDPNTHHCLCGADADLIMLGLATHEPNFTIIREEFTPNKPRPCELCGQTGHELKECQGLPKEQETVEKVMGEETAFIFLRLNILREYLERELTMAGLPFEYNFERALDDWVLMCFFVGNDFLPHLPSLEIREGAIDRLQNLYKDVVRKTGGYLSDCGVINLSRVQLVLTELGKVEDEIFKKRRQTELEFRRRDKQKKQRMARQERPSFVPGGQFAPQRIGDKPQPLMNVKQTAADMRMGRQPDNRGGGVPSLMGGDDRRGEKRKSEAAEEEDEEPADDVKLWEDGWKDRYYESKFSVDADDIEFRHTVANHYVTGLCWVLRYYYQGCASWKWYFPYHYAPFASDFVNIGDLDNDFERGTEPFKPLEQLMGVFPAASKQHLPVTWRELMTSSESPIIDFYPTDFRIDLNGKKYAWQGVALLPFVDEKRLLSALSTVYPDLVPGERKRNTRGNDRLFVSSRHSSYNFLEGLYEGGGTNEPVEIDTKDTEGMFGSVWCDEYCIQSGGVFKSPLPQCPDIQNSYVMTVKFKDPQFSPDHLFKADILPGAKFPEKVLKPEDFNQRFGNRPFSFRPQLGFQKHSGYRNTDVSAANRMIRGAQGFGAAIPPPQSLMGSNRNHNSGYGGGYGGGGPDRSHNRNYGQGGGGGGGNQGWNRNMQSQGSSYQRNQYGNQGQSWQGGQSGWSQQGRQYGGNRDSQYGGNRGDSQYGGNRGDSQYGGHRGDGQYGNNRGGSQSQGSRKDFPPPSNQRYRPY